MNTRGRLLVGLFRARSRYPRISSPLAIRLSQRPLRVILLTYLTIVALWVCLVAITLHLIDREGANAGTIVRRALLAMWSPDSLLAQANKSVPFYVMAVANALMGVLLPLFVLGAFVFKLFRHDPLVWRQRLTIEAHPSGYYVLAARFYNHFEVPVADVHVRAWLRWTAAENPTVLRNKRLHLLVGGQRDPEPAWPLAVTAGPTTVRIPLCLTSAITDPVKDIELSIQGECLLRDNATLVIIVDGTTTSVNEQFRSLKMYKLRDEIDDELFQDISPDRIIKSEWKNFDGTQLSYVFLYGSLMRRADLEAAGVDWADVMPVKLKGWRRCWNVACDPVTKKLVYRTPDGRAFNGMVVSLGLERSAHASVHGIIARVGYVALAKFDRREQEYVRTDVTRDISWPSLPVATPFRVFTYVPKREAVTEYERRKAAGELAVVTTYLHSVRDAANEVGSECLKDLNEAGGLDGVPVLDLAREDTG